MVVAITACEFSTPPKRSEMLNAITCKKGTTSIIIEPLQGGNLIKQEEHGRTAGILDLLAALEDAATAIDELRHETTSKELYGKVS